MEITNGMIYIGCPIIAGAIVLIGFIIYSFTPKSFWDIPIKDLFKKIKVKVR